MSDPQHPEGDGENTAATAAVNRLLGTNTTLGIIAGLTLAAASENPIGDDDADEMAGGQPVLAVDLVARTQQRKGASVVGAGSGAIGVPPGAPTPLKKAAGGGQTAGFSLQAPRETIQRLQEQNQLLKQELSIEARAARELLSQEKRSRVEQLRATTAAFARKLAKTQRQLTRVEAAMRRKTQELAALRVALQPVTSHEATASTGDGDADTPGKPVAAAAAAAAASGRLRVAENRLELALVRKNEVDSANKHLLARVDAARRDRAIFDGIYKKLERETAASRARHEQARGELARATHARDALARDVARLQDAAEREQLEYERQFQELKRSIAHWRHETDALQASAGLSTSGASLSPLGSASEALGATAGSNLDLGHGDLLSDLETGPEHTKEPRGGGDALSRVAALSSWKIGVDRALASGPDGLVAKYDQAFAAIRERTGLQDAAELARELLARDAANFQRFKRVEELSREEVALQTQVAQLSAQLEAVRAREGLGSRAVHKQQCRRAEAALRETQQAEAELDAEHEQLDAVLTRVKASVHSVHNLLAHAAAAGGSSTPAGGPALGRGATDANVLEYLQAIETYTTELLQSSNAEVVERSPPKARAQGSHIGVATSTSLPVALPVGHGPPTLRSDPRQKLHVQVPSFGGADGAIVLPVGRTQHASSTETHRSSTSATHTPKHRSGSSSNSPAAALSKQQMQRRRMSTRKSLSQHQFAAALAAAAVQSSGNKTSDGDPQEDDIEDGEEHEVEGATGDGSRSSAAEDEEEERALTYEELRKLAAKSMRCKRHNSGAHSRMPR